MEEIENRLRESTDQCLASYKAWKADQKDGSAREALQDSVHEIRKIASRLEIEVAVSERNQMAQKPLPIPPHRDAQRRVSESDDSEQNFNRADYNEQGGGSPAPKKRLNRRSESNSSGPRRQTGGPRKASSSD